MYIIGLTGISRRWSWGPDEVAGINDMQSIAVRRSIPCFRVVVRGYPKGYLPRVFPSPADASSALRLTLPALTTICRHGPGPSGETVLVMSDRIGNPMSHGPVHARSSSDLPMTLLVIWRKVALRPPLTLLLPSRLRALRSCAMRIGRFDPAAPRTCQFGRITDVSRRVPRRDEIGRRRERS